jgi:uncharacterized radical SAM superfamily Fe-S cluster-containing enzyme
MPHRDYTFLGTTQSLCPECLALVPAKILSRRGRVYFKKTCPAHGVREDFICSDVAWYDRMEYALPAKSPAEFGVAPNKGCPFDCGLCTEHEQHTCIGLVELTSACNLTCPMCYAESLPGGKHLPLDQICRALDRLVQVEGRAEVCQLSGGEPTIHPQFRDILDAALVRQIDYVMINTNGIRFAKDAALVDFIAARQDRVEVYFQLDGLNNTVHSKLRGEPLLETKLQALERLGAAGIHVTLVATLQAGVNEDQIGQIVEFAAARPFITGVSFQPATYSGRHVLPEELERRVTFPDVIKAIDSQTRGLFLESDFLPLPCAHPNCHQIAIGYRNQGQVTPVTRFVDARANFDLLANGLSFTRAKSRRLILSYLGRQGCCSGGCGPNEIEHLHQSPQAMIAASAGDLQQIGDESSLASDFFSRIMEQQLGAESLLRITITNFLDPYNFDVRRVMKCCTHHILPSGHVIPFCAYNTLYRAGHVPLPALDALRFEQLGRI